MAWNNQMRQSKPKHLKSALDFAIYCTMTRAIKQYPAFHRGASGFVMLTMHSDYQAENYRRSCIDLLHLGRGSEHREDASFFSVSAKTKASRVEREYREQHADMRRLIALVEDQEAIPVTLKVAADAIIKLPPISARDLQAACRVVNKIEITIAQADELLSYDPNLLWNALRTKRPFEIVLAKLTEASKSASSRNLINYEVPPLSSMFGYGPAKDWGLELAQDLHDWSQGRLAWSDVDRGILLSGPPGVGKTIFAKALANECNAHLIASSLSQWQSTGHLGDLLKAMRHDFAEAKEKAPSVLLIDELDSFGDRGGFSHDHRDYSIQVVNGLLECLDGLDGREGVVVVGATNTPQNIDPAILRSGRLDKCVHIPLPGPDDRTGILGHLLEEQLSPAQIEQLKIQTTGMTGADLAKAVRDAKRIARRERRHVSIADISLSLPKLLMLDAEYLRANAIHEAGHTLLGLELRCGSFAGTTLISQVAEGTSMSIGGSAQFTFPSFFRRDKNFYHDHIAVTLGGIAAEQVILGSIGDGGGSVEGSDLSKATRIAVMLEATMGMGSRIRFNHLRGDDDLESLLRTDQTLQHCVDKTLKEQFERATGIIIENRRLLEAYANELFESKKLTAKRAYEIEKNFKRRGTTLQRQAS